ncbi:hypothetical protein [Tellurirhabdus rosea]|uniref:hypothetical protein n=1 Tax=Tellurirhabdus rosea TaxID=2674997 RepID=UPI00224E542B|nr:hypothetical protein [Tellurirhabdus rosea]
MYQPPVSDPFFAAEGQGVWAPREHQRVIARLTGGLAPMYYQQNRIRLEPLPGTMLDESKASLVPDLSLYNNQTEQTPVIIEICHTNGLREDLQKVIRLIDADWYGIREGFVYNYRTAQWFRYRQGDGGLTQPTSYAEVLELDLNQFF